MADKIKTAFIGCGKRSHATGQGVAADSRCDVAALADISTEAAEALNEAYGFGAKVYTDYNEMLKAEKPELVISSLWTGLHLPVFRDSVDAGAKIVMSEKPMATNWADCKKMAGIAEESGCVLTFCHQRRYAPGNLKAREMIASGVFGEIKRMDLYSPCDLLDCGTHTFDQAASFMGEAHARWVLGGIDISEVTPHFALPSEKAFFGLVVYENGVRANIQAKGPDRDMPTGLRVEGTNGLIEVGWDGRYGQAVVFDDPAWKPPVLPERTKGAEMLDVVRDTLDAFEKGEEPVLSYQKALRASEIIYALYESARSRRMVELPLEIEDHPLVDMTNWEA